MGKMMILVCGLLGTTDTEAKLDGQEQEWTHQVFKCWPHFINMGIICSDMPDNQGALSHQRALYFQEVETIFEFCFLALATFRI